MKNYAGVAIVHVPVPETMLAQVFALLGGAAVAAVASSGAGAPAVTDAVKPAAAPAAAAPAAAPGVDKVAEANVAAAGATAATGADGRTHDAAGTPFDPARHTGTIVKSGLWRMKAGLSRGPGEGEESIPGAGTGTAAAGTASTSTGTVSTAPADPDDEFAAFTAAAAATGSAAPVARTWSDADLSKLCNQAAAALGAARVPEIKALIEQYVPAGDVPHSRNIIADKREEFAKALEAKAGVTFEG